jgi:hypothetical protein
VTSEGFLSLEIDADFGGSIGQKTGVFQMVAGSEGAYSVEQAIRTGYILNNAFDSLSALFTDLTGEAGDPDRKGLHLDVGGGEHAITLQFQTPGQLTTPDRTVAQWGSSPDPADGPNRHTATGETDKLTQMQVLMEYIRISTTGSLSPARLTYGQYNPDGFLDDYLSVAIEEPSILVDNRDPAWADGSMTLVETRDLNGGGDEQFLEDSG